MCNHKGCFAPGEDGQGCRSCACPATMSIEDEIRLLEDHRMYFEKQVAVIGEKIAALKSVTGS